MAKKSHVFSLCGGHCAYCGATLSQKSMTQDHVVAKAQGGGDAINNILPACKSCNSRKGADSLEVFKLRYFWNNLKPSELSSFEVAVKAAAKNKFYFERINKSKTPKKK